jgi:hypothetical protein
MENKFILYIIVGLLIFGLLVLTFYPGIITALKDSGKSVEDKCKTPQGKTDVEWREHMSHHPNIYKECLG